MPSNPASDLHRLLHLPSSPATGVPLPSPSDPPAVPATQQSTCIGCCVLRRCRRIDVQPPSLTGPPAFPLTQPPTCVETCILRFCRRPQRSTFIVSRPSGCASWLNLRLASAAASLGGTNWSSSESPGSPSLAASSGLASGFRRLSHPSVRPENSSRFSTGSSVEKDIRSAQPVHASAK